jgi:hypothetical protein
MPYDRLRLSEHVIIRMAQRGFARGDVRRVLEEGEVIETYPGDEPYPSYLMLGQGAGGRPIHVVAADNGKEEETIVITIYEPDPERWSDDFRTRLPKDDE